MQENFDKHAPWRIVHAAIAGLLALKAAITGVLLLALGVVVE